MPKFYFTYGDNEELPYQDGWTEIEAPDEGVARKMFNAIHPSIGENRPMRCAFVYSEEAFLKTKMPTGGNFGKFCHERITYAVYD